MTDAEAWNYFHEDTAYADVLADRLRHGVEMDSAVGMGMALRDTVQGDVSILDFGSGPGHYLPVLRRLYDRGAMTYRGVDIVASSVEIGNRHFVDDPMVSFDLGSVLEPGECWNGETCIISANTLPHVPAIEPLLGFLRETSEVSHFVFRMLVGRECVEIRKHLSETSFDGMFETGYQLNNIYSAAYLADRLGPEWTIDVRDDHVDLARLEQHSVPFQTDNPFYGNRVSRRVGDITFKGDIYMPWKFVTGRRIR